MKRVWQSGAGIWLTVVMTTPAWAQGARKAEGWPTPPAAAIAETARVAATTPPAPASTSTSTSTSTSARRAAKSAPMVRVAVAPDAAPAHRATASPPLPSNAELLEVLQQQSTLLSRLTSELEAQRAVIAAQQAAITVLEARSSTPAAAIAVTATPAPVAAPVITVETGGTKLRFGGLVQGWYSTGSGVTNTFRLRRTELKLTGDLNPRTRWTMMIDPAKTLNVTNSYTTVDGTRVVSDTAVSQSGRLLQDAFVSLTYAPSLTVELGQQRVPFGYEGVLSASRLDTLERALYMSDRGRAGSYGDVRDLGVIARGQLGHGLVEYAGGVFNGLGESMNEVDRNGQKAVAGRVVLHPAIKGLQFGGSIARGAFQSTDATRRGRAGVELLYARAWYSVRSELMTGNDGLISRRGYYMQGMARLRPTLQAVLRADVWDPDTRNELTAVTVAERDWVAGLNFQPRAQKVLLQFNYVRKTFMDVQPPRHVFLTNVQTAW